MTEETIEKVQPVHVVIDGDVSEKDYASTFGSWNSYPMVAAAVPIQILPQRPERDRAVIWLSSVPDAAGGVLLASSYENAQSGVGGLLTAIGQQIVVESQQRVFAILVGAGATVFVSVHDETWQVAKK